MGNSERQIYVFKVNEGPMKGMGFWGTLTPQEFDDYMSTARHQEVIAAGILRDEIRDVCLRHGVTFIDRGSSSSDFDQQDYFEQVRLAKNRTPKHNVGTLLDFIGISVVNGDLYDEQCRELRKAS